MTEKFLALIIEDDEDLSFIFSEALHAAGFDTEVIRDGQLAMDRLAGKVPKMVVLDLHLPNVSGPEILRKIRSEDRTKGICTIITTADAQMAEYDVSEADFVLIKPISFAQLRDITSRLKMQLDL